MARFANGKSPFLRIADEKNQGTTIIMRDFIIGLTPVILFSWFKNGILVFYHNDTDIWGMFYPLLFILVSGMFALLMEGIFHYITDSESRTLPNLVKKLQTSYAVIPGLILGLLLPIHTPLWVLAFASFMGTIVGKMLFGGFGHNIFNPALIGYITVGFTFLGIINDAGGLMNNYETMIDSYAGATSLTSLNVGKMISYDLLVKPYGSLWNFFLGTTPGTLGETSALVMLVSYLWLSFRKVIKWFTPVVYVGTVFVLSWFIGMLSGVPQIWFPTYSILAGGLVFGAVFMATEPVTTPRNPLGKIYYALLLGTLTVLFRFVGSMPEGVATALVVMNLFTLPIDNYTAVIRAKKFGKPALGKIIILSTILLVLIIYTVFKAGSMYNLSVLQIYVGGGM